MFIENVLLLPQFKEFGPILHDHYLHYSQLYTLYPSNVLIPPFINIPFHYFRS